MIVTTLYHKDMKESVRLEVFKNKNKDYNVNKVTIEQNEQNQEYSLHEGYIIEDNNSNYKILIECYSPGQLERDHPFLRFYHIPNYDNEEEINIENNTDIIEIKVSKTQ